jgi:hypothetical protein
MDAEAQRMLAAGIALTLIAIGIRILFWGF